MAPSALARTRGGPPHLIRHAARVAVRGTDGYIVTGTTQANALVDVVRRPCANPAAIELSDGKLGAAIPLDQRFDTTGATTVRPAP